MDDKELRHDRKYVWYGAFGFAGAEDDLPFSGMVSYSPSEGIHVKILTEDTSLLDEGRTLVRGKMHALVSDEHGFRHLTLLNVFLGSYRTNLRATEVEGTAELLLDTWIYKSTSVRKIQAEYCRAFEDFMFWRSSRDSCILDFSGREGFSTQNGWRVSFSDNSIATVVGKANDLDTVFWTRTPEALTELKRVTSKVFEEYSGQILRRKNLRFYISFEHDDNIFAKYLSKLEQWESFVGFLIDDILNPQSIYILFEDKENFGERSQKKQMLFWVIGKMRSEKD
ncbi:hypothetical protein [Thalassospira aquimaris]|uniref:ApeA N-terminal domain-containing protein n=1 Tax=Thalassospira aquimaris TaxID=3037796 RepID=A0ABT6GBQ6_9PROT|nr:hypothetical protein [Thalassospira sp. FZY0004]MDG4719434.1 hypothetical protein [Thalassospira sp. FZY0004]